MDQPIVIDSISVAEVGSEALSHYEVAMARVAEGDAFGSLEHFAAAEARMSKEWSFLLNYGMAMKATSTAAVMVAGRREPVVRSSLERILMLQRARMLYQKAERLAVDPRARALVASAQGRLLAFVGSPFDAKVCFDRAARLFPGVVDEREQMDALLNVSCGPEQTQTSEETSGP